MTAVTSPIEFRPNRLIAPQLVQTLLGSMRPVRRRWLKLGNRMDALAQQHVLACSDGIRLTGMHSRQPAGIEPRGLVVLIHGWEGSHDSVYLYSMACRIFEAGWNVFRLNLRDHAGSHALNEELFHSARMTEVLDAVRLAQKLDGASRLAVVGFSLGGNFALRAGLQGPATGIVPLLSVGISPSIDPRATLQAIDDGPRVFRNYFLDKWRATLKAKAQAWPGRYDFGKYMKIDQFMEVTRHYVADFTRLASMDEYLATYTLTPEMLMASPSPLAVLTAQDDTMIPMAGFAGLRAKGSVVAYDAPKRGGHCGFIENFAMESWAERRVMALLDGL